MTITESRRHRLHEALIHKLGEEEASTLMEYLPPVGWADVATKSDLESLRVATSADIENLRVVTSADIENFRVATKSDFESLRAATSADIGSLRAETTAEFRALEAKMDSRFEAVDHRFNALEANVTAALAKAFSSQMRWVVATMIAFYAIFGVLLSLLR